MRRAGTKQRGSDACCDASVALSGSLIMTGGQAGPHRDTDERQQGADSCMREAVDAGLILCVCPSFFRILYYG